MAAILQGKDEKLVVAFGLVCSSFVMISRGSTHRHFFLPEGDLTAQSVKAGNCLAARTLGCGSKPFGPIQVCILYIYIIYIYIFFIYLSIYLSFHPSIYLSCSIIFSIFSIISTICWQWDHPSPPPGSPRAIAPKPRFEPGGVARVPENHGKDMPVDCWIVTITTICVQ
jgi:hypothetical protein